MSTQEDSSPNQGIATAEAPAGGPTVWPQVVSIDLLAPGLIFCPKGHRQWAQPSTACGWCAAVADGSMSPQDALGLSTDPSYRPEPATPEQAVQWALVAFLPMHGAPAIEVTRSVITESVSGPTNRATNAEGQRA